MIYLGPTSPANQKPSQPTPKKAQVDGKAPSAPSNDAYVELSKTNTEEAARLERLREDYRLQIDSETARLENAVENQKQSGNEAIRDVKRSQEEDLRKIKRDGEKRVSHLQSFYKEAASHAENEGKQKLRELQAQSSSLLQNEQADASFQLQESRTKLDHQVDRINRERETNLKDAQEQNDALTQRLREQFSMAQESADQFHRENIAQKYKEQSGAFLNVARKTEEKLQRLQMEAANRIARYSSKQEDPFYQLVDLQAELHEDDGAFILKAKIPKHEQEHVSVSVQGNLLVVSGYRRNEEKSDLGPGHKKTTASFQSFQESFPLSFPVDAKRIHRVAEGDTLLIEIPKLIGTAHYEPKASFRHQTQYSQSMAPTQPKLDLPQPQEENSSTPGEGSRGKTLLES